MPQNIEAAAVVQQICLQIISGTLHCIRMESCFDLLEVECLWFLLNHAPIARLPYQRCVHITPFSKSMTLSASECFARPK